VTRGSVGLESKRKSKLTTAVLMVTAVGGVVSGARKAETKGVFIGQGRHKQLRPERRAYRNHDMGSKAVGDVRQGSGQWWMAVRPRVCAVAVCHRHRGRQNVTPVGT
jgi:hypothetical protein